MITVGEWCGERITEAEGGEGRVCIWQPLTELDKEVGYCIDFKPADIDSLIELLQQLKTVEPFVLAGGNEPITESDSETDDE